MNFSLKEFENTNTNTKIKVFIQYLYEKCEVSASSEDFDNEYFSLLDDDDLIESLEYYIAKNSITAQVTAKNYITYITNFFNNTLFEKYGITNDIFRNTHINKQFISKSNEIISNLKKSESKDIATDEECEELNVGINKFLNELVIDDIYDEINKYHSTDKKHLKIYHNFVSTIAIKLIMKFALGSSTTVSLEFDDLDMKNNVIFVNGFNLPLDEELFLLFEKYLKIREYVLNLYAMQESKLFIKYTGKPYIKEIIDKPKAPHKDYASFFKIMKVILRKTSADLFTTRSALEMLDKGIDIETVSKLSDISIKKCIKLQNNNNDEVDKKLQLFFSSKEPKSKSKFINKKTINNKKGYFKCPFCGNNVQAISDELILVQFENDNTKYLACRKCRGANEKYSI